MILQLRKIADALRGFGLGLQADQIMEVVEALKPRELLPVLADFDHPRAYPSKETMRWLASKLTEAAEIIAELQADAEITGSTEAFERATTFLNEMGLIKS